MNAIRTLRNQSGEVDEQANITIATDRIQNAFWFPQANDRHDDIKHAYKDTFQWIFSGKNKQETLSCTFME